MDDFEKEIKNDFLNEAKELLVQVEAIFLRLENERENMDLLLEIFRLAHNLKGASKAVGFNQLSDLTHSAENLILKIKEGLVKPTDKIVSVLLEFKDVVTNIVEELSLNHNYQADIETLKAKINAATTVSQEVESLHVEEGNPEISPIEDVLVDDVPSIDKFNDEPSDGVIVDNSILKSNQEADAVTNQPTTSGQVDDEKINYKNPPSEIAKDAVDKSTNIEETVRVKLSRVNELNDVIGELVILQNVLNQRRFVYIQDALSNKTITLMIKLFKEVQGVAMSLRMLSIKSTFQKMNRIVRDTSKVLGKDVNLNLIGEDIEVDKTVVEKISDPLVHLIRNAVDHGVELPEERVANGKSPTGNIALSASYEGNNVVITIVDDGKGIDPRRIRQKAIEKKVINFNQSLTDRELQNLIFHPGFSTKDAVTEVSGRGVGLDVVKTNIEQLDGTVEVSSELGKGSTFRITLPLTLAIIDGLIVTVNTQTIVVPLGQITELIRVHSEKLIRYTGAGNFFRLRDEVIPVYGLAEKLGIKYDSSHDQILILLRGESRAIGVLVGNITNQQQIVIKKVGDEIKDVPGIMGAAILGDGHPSFIIDLKKLFDVELKASHQDIEGTLAV